MRDKGSLILVLLILIALVLGYFLPDGLAVLTDRSRRETERIHSLQELPLQEQAQGPTLGTKMEWMGTENYTLAVLEEGEWLDFQAVYDLSVEILMAITDMEPVFERGYLQPCVAFFPERGAFVVWRIHMTFSDGGSFILLLDDATKGVLQMEMLVDSGVAYESLHCALSQDGRLPSDALTQRVIDTLIRYNHISEATYVQETAELSFLVDKKEMTAHLYVDPDILNMVFNFGVGGTMPDSSAALEEAIAPEFGQ